MATNKDEKRDKRLISAILATGAEYLVMGEIVAHTGLIVSHAPRNNANFDIIVNNHELSKAARIEVKHSRSQFKANVSGGDFDFLVFVYTPSDKGNTAVLSNPFKRKIYVFPRSVVMDNLNGIKNNNFNPNKIPIKNNNLDDEYLNKFKLILNALT